ncbi:MAG: hypothetical protein ACR2HG_12230 [Pyrinomonadaceae bacterium]
MKNTLRKTAVIILLALALTASATPAQENNKRDGGAVPWLVYDGVETSAGTYDSLNAMQWGETFYAQNAGDAQTNCLTVSINHSTARIVPIDGERQNGDEVLSGNWSLTVFRANRAVGTIFGEVTGGVTNKSDRQTKNSTVRQIQITLRTTGGTDEFKQIGKRNIIGTFDAVKNIVGEKPNIVGTLSFNF